MRRTALSVAVLLGLASCAATEARATPTIAATVTIASGTVQVGGKRDWSKHGWSNRHWRKAGWSHWRSDRGWRQRHWSKGDFHRKGVVRQHKRPHRFGRHDFGRHDFGRHHRPAFVTKRFHKGPVVIVRPAFGHSFGRRYLPTRPPIQSGSFARRFHHW